MSRPIGSGPGGTLYVVATPIGNLEDITLRALKVLKAVDLVAAEDTRRTGNLLRHYGITTPLISVREHNEQEQTAGLVARLAAGQSVALVTDAGTPAISDPGAAVVSGVRTAGFKIEPIPGASAVVAALSAAGIVSEGFAFLGFPPYRLNARIKWLASAADESNHRTILFFEAPHRIKGTLGELSKLVNRPILLCRELTKVHEEIRLATPAQLADVMAAPKGEFTVVIPQAESSESAQPAATDSEVFDLFGQITEKGPGRSRREVIKLVAKRLGLAPKAVYQALERAKFG